MRHAADVVVKIMEITYLNWRDEFVYCKRKDFRFIKGLGTRGGKVPVKIGRVLCNCEWCQQDLKRYYLDYKITIDIKPIMGFINE